MTSYDLFVSHASEDKATLVEPLATILSTAGVAVWYDASSLEPGDSLSRSIDRGLAQSRFGVVILSPSFLSKPWPEYELRGLTSKELGRDKVIIPVWFGVTRDDVLAFSPPLADKLAINASRLSREEVAAELLRVVRPDLFNNLRRLVLAKNVTGHGFPVGKLLRNKIQHAVFPKTILSRINVVRHVFFEFLPETLEQAADHFQRDIYPEEEIALWESMAAVYLDFKHEFNPEIEQRKGAYEVVMTLSAGSLPSKPRARWPTLSARDIKFLRDRWAVFGIQLPITRGATAAETGAAPDPARGSGSGSS